MVVVGIPKTIDNDIELLDKTFGFDTAVEEAQRAINAAYTEVSACPLFRFISLRTNRLAFSNITSNTSHVLTWGESIAGQQCI